jgi:hypothetical protein
MRNKQYLAAIRPRGGALAMSTMRTADEFVTLSHVDGRSPKSSEADCTALGLTTQDQAHRTALGAAQGGSKGLASQGYWGPGTVFKCHVSE